MFTFFVQTRMTKFTFWKILFLTTLFHSTLQFEGFFVEKIVCNHSTTICQNPVCFLSTPDDKPQEFHLTFGCGLLKPVRFRTSKKVGKRFKLTSFNHFEFNLCAALKVGLNPVVLKFVPDLANQMERLFHPCPYTDKFMVDDIITDGASMPILFNKRQIKTEMIFVSGMEEFFTVAMFGKTGESVIDL